MHGWLLRLSSRSQWLVEEGAVVEATESDKHVLMPSTKLRNFFEAGDEGLSRYSILPYKYNKRRRKETKNE